MADHHHENMAFSLCRSPWKYFVHLISSFKLGSTVLPRRVLDSKISFYERWLVFITAVAFNWVFLNHMTTEPKGIRLVLLVALLLATVNAAAGSFNLALIDKHGTALNSAKCNIQTTLDFSFSSSTTASSANTVVHFCWLRSTQLSPLFPS